MRVDSLESRYYYFVLRRPIEKRVIARAGTVGGIGIAWFGGGKVHSNSICG